jgi:hypothetical protein
MRVFRQCVVGSALALCLGLSLGPVRAQDFRPLPKFVLENASPILHAPYIRVEKPALLNRRNRSADAIGATCSATACKTDSDCGSGCECNDDSVCGPSD